MRKWLIALGLTAILATPGIAMAAAADPDLSGFYVAPKFVYSYQTAGTVDISVYSDSMDSIDGSKKSAYGGALAIGYDWKPRFCTPIRTEIEGAFRTAAKRDFEAQRETIATHKRQVSTIFANVYWDLDFLGEGKSPLVPYIGAGIGVAFINSKLDTSRYDNVDFSTTQTNFAWNVGAGIAYKFTKNIALDVGYRYAQFGDAKLKFPPTPIEAKHKVSAHEVMAGLRFTF